MVKEMRSCPGCARSIDEQQFPYGLAFCPYCGETLPPVEQVEALRYCPYCGLEQSCSPDFCPHCGKKILVSKAAPRDRIQPEPVPPIRFQTVTTPLDEAPVCPPEDDEEMDYSGYGTGYAANYRPQKRIFTTAWEGTKAICRKFTGVIAEFVSGRYQVKRLYHTWTRHSALPEDAVPSGEALAQITRECGAESYRPLRLSLVILAFAGLVIFFVGVGFVIRSC
jgi:DNA-directed RNA polymerase subunit RPC12/RpoP